MKNFALLLMVMMISAGAAQAETATAYVGTALGANAFDVQNGGTQLYYHPQPDTDYVWWQNNGAAPETVLTYTSGGQTYNRDGMKTFACTDVAYGQRLDSIRMEFDYFTGADPTTGINMVNYPGINIAITDGAGHYATWSATSGGTAFTTAPIAEKAGWSHLVLDCTNLTDNTWGKANEFNGGLSTDRPLWHVIQGWTIAGFYDYQQAPQGGFGAWNQTLWSDITEVNNPSATANEYGVVLCWGDTVGGMTADGSGEIGSAAERAYGQTGRMINNYVLTVGGTAYSMSFEAGAIPEPATMSLLGLGAIALLKRSRK